MQWWSHGWGQYLENCGGQTQIWLALFCQIDFHCGTASVCLYIPLPLLSVCVTKMVNSDICFSYDALQGANKLYRNCWKHHDSAKGIERTIPFQLLVPSLHETGNSWDLHFMLSNFNCSSGVLLEHVSFVYWTCYHVQGAKWGYSRECRTGRL